MTVQGKLEVTIKINRLPSEVSTDKNGWKEFTIDFGKRGAKVSLRPRMWNKLEQAASTFPHWVAVLTGVMGEDVGKGVFKLLEPNLQVFEYKPKEPAAAAPATETTETPAKPAGAEALAEK